MKPLITEKEFYNYCSMYVTENREQCPREGEQRSYLLICLYETKEDIGTWASIVDPAISARIKTKDLIKMPWVQQILIRLGPKIRKLLKKEINNLKMVNNVANVLNISPEKLMETIIKSESPEEAKRKLEAMISNG